MSHLGELLTAFVDGELNGAERDRATVHLAQCGTCRTEAGSQRELKQQLRQLGDTRTGARDDTRDELSRRLLAVPDAMVTETGIKVTAGPRRLRRKDARRPGGSRGPVARKIRIKPGKRRYVVFGTVSVVVGIGAAAFSMGGTDAAPGPRITPQVELYSEEHAITTGEVPFTAPPAEMAVTGRSASRADRHAKQPSPGVARQVHQGR